MHFSFFTLLSLTLLSCTPDFSVDGGSLNVSPDGTSSSPISTIPTPNTSLNSSSDPLLGYSWHLGNNGQNAFAALGGKTGIDVNADSVFQAGNKGQNVRVAVIDSGTELLHPDLQPNIDFGDSIDFIDGDQDTTNTEEGHGTLVAGIIAARDNDIGSRGIAPRASIISYRTGDTQIRSAALYAAYDQEDDIPIYNLSLGGADEHEQIFDRSERDLMVAAVNNKRSGKGAVLVKAAGNDMYTISLSSGSSLNQQAEGNLHIFSSQHEGNQSYPYFLIVGSTNANGIKSDYSQIGANLWLSAPSGEIDSFDANVYNLSLSKSATVPQQLFLPSILTTDLSGCTNGDSIQEPREVNISSTSLISNAFLSPTSSNLNPKCNYSSVMSGTSAATPMVSGVTALLFAENPNLSWRDVKHIYAKTARKIDPSLEYFKKAEKFYSILAPKLSIDHSHKLDWQKNSAGYNFHNAYGFGLVDAAAAVNYLKNEFSPMPALDERVFASIMSEPVAIPDQSNLLQDYNIKASDLPENYILESVRVTVDIEHEEGGEIGVEIESPSGTKSILQYSNNSIANNPMSTFSYLSNAFYGETGQGNWQLKVIDSKNDTSGSLKSWNMRFYGHVRSPSP